MKRKILELAMVTIITACMAPIVKPEAPKPEPEREVIDLPWDFGTVDEEVAVTPEYDIDLMAQVVMAECANEPFIGKVAVVSTILNRRDNWGMSIPEVIYYPNAYCSSFNGVPTEEAYRAIAFAIEERNVFPADMMYFRNKHYHTFGTPYMQIGNHYFSTK